MFRDGEGRAVQHLGVKKVSSRCLTLRFELLGHVTNFTPFVGGIIPVGAEIYLAGGWWRSWPRARMP